MFNKHNFALAKLADKGKSRFATGGLYVCPSETVVTDGHHLTRVSKVADGEEFKAVGLAADTALTEEFKPFIMPADAALKVSKEKLPNRWSEKRIAVAAESEVNGHSAIVVADNVQRAPKIDGQFPEYLRCVPNPEALGISISFNPKLLADILLAHAALQDAVNLPTVVLRMKDGNSAFTVESSYDGQTMHSTVMPCRMP